MTARESLAALPAHSRDRPPPPAAMANTGAVLAGSFNAIHLTCASSSFTIPVHEVSAGLEWNCNKRGAITRIRSTHTSHSLQIRLATMGLGEIVRREGVHHFPSFSARRSWWVDLRPPRSLRCGHKLRGMPIRTLRGGWLVADVAPTCMSNDHPSRSDNHAASTAFGGQMMFMFRYQLPRSLPLLSAWPLTQ